jgi:hypothetical protein
MLFPNYILPLLLSFLASLCRTGSLILAPSIILDGNIAGTPCSRVFFSFLPMLPLDAMFLHSSPLLFLVPSCPGSLSTIIPINVLFLGTPYRFCDDDDGGCVSSRSGSARPEATISEREGLINIFIVRLLCLSVSFFIMVFRPDYLCYLVIGPSRVRIT